MSFLVAMFRLVTKDFGSLLVHATIVQAHCKDFGSLLVYETSVLMHHPDICQPQSEARWFPF